MGPMASVPAALTMTSLNTIRQQVLRARVRDDARVRAADDRQPPREKAFGL